ncbi:murein transglycosylase A [Rhodoferax aquaticus]|uniref:peptidoglycan lytic exotransglycosylase n=1 Tax=Rhodoferax aquaticus TaxID=2527691 RepID=A0A515EK89_9BURK|nr:MltA domain-containing protein [Rhodoferax aquaticus]QDL53068.1 transglycosylase [Rhodoferax aquaticus]
MVHQMIQINKSPAPRASSSNSSMARCLNGLALALIVGSLVACGSAPMAPVGRTLPPPARTATVPSTPAVDTGPIIQQPKSRWVAVDWSGLPGFEDDNLFEAWNAWLKSCERPAAALAALCGDVRRLSIGSGDEQRAWMQSKLQPYRVESLQGDSNGLLTSYFEPMLEASRTPSAAFSVPIYQVPPNLASRKPWYSRQEIDTLPEAQAALKGRVIAYLADPVDALVLQIQGSGRMRITQADGSLRWARLAYAGTNDQPYRSVGRWLLDQGLIKDASWPGIKAWLIQNPQRQQELLWSNPRVVFFKEEILSDLDASFGPKGAQGVALTPGRSIAVDPGSIPYGTPVWLASTGAQSNLQRLVLAQDTGSAITGAVRADYFAGWGSEAGELAGRMKQNLQMWTFWPK